jgi:endoglucanase Acf2
MFYMTFLKTNFVHMKTFFFSLFFFCFAGFLSAQQPIVVGKGSYAEYTPFYKSHTDEHGGDQSRIMETRKLYIEGNEGLPIPTNDWWTDLLTNPYSGNLWAYPQMVKAEAYGISIAFPKEWEANGNELKWQSHLEILGKKFKPAAANANTWHDWGFNFRMKDNEKEMLVTLAHGIPFTWLETTNLDLQIRTQNATYYSKNGTLQLPYTGSEIVIQIGNDAYGIYAPENTVFSEKNGLLEIAFAGEKHFLSIGVLPSRNDLMAFAEYAYTLPRKTTVNWNYDETAGKVITRWDIATENLKGGSQNKVLQGFIPHHYKNSEYSFAFLPYEYATPRGKMKIAAGNNFSISYKFNGILPYFAAPEENADLQNPYQRERMKQLISEYADKGSFGGDTYWGGKGLTQMGLYMTFAYEMGETELFEQCKNRLKSVLVNWLTYTPGENNFFFARYNRWGAMVGYDTSYDSDTFNDHHFHYGYYTYAASLLALFDEDFRTNYGEMITLIAKDYANWDREDLRFPFFRTLDPWAGHSYAGGLGNNGNGQESTSEAMQGWGGLYLLGVATNNKAMRNAGIFGWTLEARGTAEYWFDRDRENIDYTKYTHPYNSNLTSQGVGWWTWFSGDPVWMHSIQWMPISPCLKYLYEDLNFARWDYTQMWNSKEVGDWTVQTGLESSLSYESGLGNVVLTYLQIFDPDSAASVFDTAWEAQMPIAKNPDTGGISYYVTHSHRTYGDICWDIHADIPTATVYKHPQTGKFTYMVYNPSPDEKVVHFYQNGSLILQFVAPPSKLTVYSDAPVLSSVKIKTPASIVVEPGKTLQLEAVLYDQYGASMAGNSTWSAGSGGQISSSGLFTAGINKGVSVTVTIQSGSLSDAIILKINDKPQLTAAQIIPQQTYLEVGRSIDYKLIMTDQYGETYPATVGWEIVKDNQIVKTGSLFDLQNIGKYTIRAKVEGHEYHTEVYLTPSFANIALNKTTTASSEENAGTLKANATDGDFTTRWGSQHSDPQWIYVDLGAVSYISHVTLVWEAAYATLYDIQLSDNKQDWQTVETVNGGGGTEITEINAFARYVRMYGRQRATQYGYSLYELEVYGVPPVGIEPALFGIDIQPRSGILKEGESLQLSALGYDQYGNTMSISPQFRIVSGTGTITSSGVFTPTKYGIVVVEAKVNNKTAKASFVVEESIKLKSLSILPKKVMMITGTNQRFSCLAKDQFGAEFPAESLVYSVVGEGAGMNGSVFTADFPGDYLVIAGAGNVRDTASVRVDNITDVNLAFLKPVTASSYENVGTIPENVNDGDQTTRWGSAFSTPEYIEIDLSGNYLIDRIDIFWEAAYATVYKVEISDDEENWTIVYNENNGTGGKKAITFSPLPARYVRVTCLQRYTQYGSSIYELEVYGLEFLGGTDLKPEKSAEPLWVGQSGKTLVVEGNQLQEISVYDIRGTLISRFKLDEKGNRFEKQLAQVNGIIFVQVRTAKKQQVFKIYFR